MSAQLVQHQLMQATTTQAATCHLPLATRLCPSIPSYNESPNFPNLSPPCLHHFVLWGAIPFGQNSDLFLTWLFYLTLNLALFPITCLRISKNDFPYFSSLKALLPWLWQHCGHSASTLIGPEAEMPLPHSAPCRARS